MYKIDLHSHSTLSHDGGISESEYCKILDDNILNYVAVTDHNDTDFAIKLRKKLGDRIIVGEEIMTSNGEILGLYLTSRIEPGLTSIETVKRIVSQGGVVYIPHPFHNFRSSMTLKDTKDLLTISKDIIIEVFNARTAYFTKSQAAHAFSDKHNLAKGSSSDAHCKWGIGRTYMSISDKPTANNLYKLVKNSSRVSTRAPIHSLLCPKINIVRKILHINHD